MKKIFQILGISFLCFQAYGANVLLDAVEEASQAIGYSGARINLKKAKVAYITSVHPEVSPEAIARIVGLGCPSTLKYIKECKSGNNSHLLNLLGSEGRDEIEASIRGEERRGHYCESGLHYLRRKYPGMRHPVLSRIFLDRGLFLGGLPPLSEEQKADLDAVVVQKMAEVNEEKAECAYIEEAYPWVPPTIVGQVIGVEVPVLSFYRMDRKQKDAGRGDTLSTERRREIAHFMDAVQGRIAEVRAKIGYIESKYPGHSVLFVKRLVGVEIEDAVKCKRLDNVAFLGLLSQEAKNSIDSAVEEQVTKEKARVAYLCREFRGLDVYSVSSIVGCSPELVTAYQREKNASLIETLSEDTRRDLDRLARKRLQ